MQVMSSVLDGTYHMKSSNNFSRLNYAVSISINKHFISIKDNRNTKEVLIIRDDEKSHCVNF